MTDETRHLLKRKEKGVRQVIHVEKIEKERQTFFISRMELDLLEVVIG